jgi:hypothetical protein
MTQSLIIRRYYPWGAKRIPHSSIRSVKRRPLSPIRGKWRIWVPATSSTGGTLTPGQPHKAVALEIDLGRRVVPTITPDDSDTVEGVLTEQLRHQ